MKWAAEADAEATPSISDEELARAKTIFFQNDKDENGSIDRSELQWMLKELGQNPTDEMLDQRMVRRGARNSSSPLASSPLTPPAARAETSRRRRRGQLSGCPLHLQLPVQRLRHTHRAGLVEQRSPPLPRLVGLVWRRSSQTLPALVPAHVAKCR